MRLFGRRRHRPESPSVDDTALRSAVEEVLLRELAAGALDPGDEVPRPLTRSRLVAWAGATGTHHFIDSEGDLGWLWHHRRYAAILLGDDADVLEVRGEWNRSITIERLEEVLEICNEWNATRIWPRAYARVLDNGLVHAFTKVAVPLEHGVTDAQLDQLVGVGLHTAAAFFDTLDDVYPDPAGSMP